MNSNKVIIAKNKHSVKYLHPPPITSKDEPVYLINGFGAVNLGWFYQKILCNVSAPSLVTFEFFL